MITIDNSILKEVKKCHLSAALRYIYHLQGGCGVAGEVGSSFHQGLEQWMWGSTPEDCLLAFEKYYRSNVTVAEISDDRYEFSNCYKIFSVWLEKNPLSEKPFRVLEAEKGILFPLSSDIQFYGKRDGLIEMKHTSERLPLDHKTCNRITDWKKKAWMMGSQFSGYMEGSVREGYPGDSLLVNVIEISKLPLSKRKCYIHKKPFEECWPLHVSFQAILAKRSRAKIELWKKTALQLAHQFMEMKGEVGRNGLQNILPTGSFNDDCQFCEFFKLCKEDFSEVAWGRLKRKEWNPWQTGQ